MYKANLPTKFFFRHLFCGGGRRFGGHHLNNSAVPGSSFIYYEKNGIPITNSNSSSSSFESYSNQYNDINKPHYFQLNDHHLKKIDKLNEHFLKFYSRHDCAPYVEKFEKIFDGWENQFSRSRGFRSPKTTINETENGIDIVVELPGFSKDNVSLEFSKNLLNISTKSTKSSSTETTSQQPQQQQQQSSELIVEFKKLISLPDDIDTSLVKATMNNGVLQINIPKNSYIKTKSINIE